MNILQFTPHGRAYALKSVNGEIGWTNVPEVSEGLERGHYTVNRRSRAVFFQSPVNRPASMVIARSYKATVGQI